ncbi:MAG: DUF1513 domain-containing protein [Pseudomonadota bacterium]
MTSRRQFLIAAAGTLTTTNLGGPIRPPRARFVSAATTVGGDHAVAGIDTTGELLFTTPIGFRGHEVVVTPDRESAIVVGRRPRTQAVRIRLDDGAVVDRFATDSNRHFYGHGVFTEDGKYFLTSENDFDNRRGVITIRDADSLHVVEEFDSFGTGPHEMRWLSDGRTLAVANGGIETHPASGREKLNIDSMQPNLVFINTQNGALIHKVEPRYRQNSVRHIDLLGDDRVVVGMQQEDGSATDRLLVAVADRDDTMQSLAMPPADLRELAQYTASVCVDAGTGHAIATCPRGNRVSFWQARHGQYRGAVRIADAAGICVDTEYQHFVVTTGRGLVYRFRCDNFESAGQPVRISGISWDNHLTAV